MMQISFIPKSNKLTIYDSIIPVHVLCEKAKLKGGDNGINN